MPVTEVQWIGASCGRHSSYTFYRGFRLIVDGVKKNFCLGEFYFVRNSTNQPICIAELQLVWHDASTDSQLASARLYFRPEDTPLGRLPNHGQDELLYADQKVVIKCQDMAVWQDSGLQWNFGMVPLYETDFVCFNDKYYLSSNYVVKEKERLLNAREAWQNEDHSRSLQILTFPAYCRYRALKERLLAGACLSRPQLVALGGVLEDQTSTRVLFCRDSFHHPYLDKFELSGDNKAPVLKGRPRKKKKLNATQNSVLKKKRFVEEIQNHLTNSPAAKRCKILEEEEESASSDVSEAGVLERIKVPPQAVRAAQSNGPPPLIKPRVQIISPKPSEINKAVVQNVPSANPKAPPPLISANKTKDAPRITQPSHEQLNVKVLECSRTTPMQKQIFSTDAKLRRVEQSNNNSNNNNNNNNTAVLVKSHLPDNIQPNMTSASFTSTSSSLESRTVKILNSSVRNNHLLHPLPGKTVTNTNNNEHIRTIPAVEADTRSSTTSSARPVTTTQGTVGTQLAVSIGPAVRSQPVASMPQPVSSAQGITSKSQQLVTPLAGSTTTVKASDGVNTGSTLSVRSKQSKENEEWQFRSASEEKKENEKEQTEEPVVWKKKKKRLRMPGSVKDEVYDDEDEKYFMQTLGDFMKQSNQPLGKLPALGFKKVNLWTMYNTAQRFGGYDAVTSKRLWRRVYDSLGGSTTITSAATYTRRHYERLLLPYERHIRSQLKKQMDEKNPSTDNKPSEKEPLNKPEKKQGLAVSNNRPKPNVCSDSNKAPAVKQNQGANPAKPQQSNTAMLSVQALPVKMKISSDAKGNAVKTTVSDSVRSSHAVTTSSNSKSSPAPVRPVRPVKQEYQEHKTLSDKTRTSVSQPVSLEVEKKETIPSEQYQVASSQQNTNHYCIKVTNSDEETSARTNTIYTKNAAAMKSNSKQFFHGAPLQRVTHDGTPMSSPPHQLHTVIKGREIIDLTSEDSPPRPQSSSHSLPHGQGAQANSKEISKVPRLVSARDTDGARRHSSKSHSRKEYNDSSSRHQSIREVQPSREMSTAYDKPTYSVKPQIKPKISDSSPVSRVESMEGRLKHTPSSDSVDEHFAEWLRRQSNIPQQHTKSHAIHQRQTGNPEMGKLRYNYIKEGNCPPDCSCSLSTSRKDEIMSIPPPKPKKEHYEEDLPFAGMALYPGRWSPTMIAADHHDLYISSHSAHLPAAPPDSLASHMCTASRIFIPTAQIFSPPYHLGVAPMGASPLIAGTDDQLHIHPHCLMASSYPCTSNSRTPDGAAYPLYSFT